MLRTLAPVILASVLAAADSSTAAPVDPDQARASFLIGVQHAMRTQTAEVVNGYGLDREEFLKGMAYALGEMDQSAFADAQAVMQRFQQGQQARHLARVEADKKWLTENGAKPGITTTKSGLQYQVLTAGPGTGASAAQGMEVTCHYEGRRLDGLVFDSSIKRGEPATFTVGKVIPGWNEALALMKPGDKWRLFIPSELAYGNQPRGASIRADEVLVFDLELLAVGGRR